MSYRVQYTALTARENRKYNLGAVDSLRHNLARGLADDAEEVIDILQHYPGETHKSLGATANRAIHRHYVTTGQLQVRTLRGFRLEFASISSNRGYTPGQFLGRTLVAPERGEYERTGLLGQSWNFTIKDEGTAITLVFTNTAHDRPGNYYAGWVHGLNAPGSGAKYYQTQYNADAKWPTFASALARAHVKENAQAEINDYLKNVGLL